MVGQHFQTLSHLLSNLSPCTRLHQSLKFIHSIIRLEESAHLSLTSGIVIRIAGNISFQFLQMTSHQSTGDSIVWSRSAITAISRTWECTVSYVLSFLPTRRVSCCSSPVCHSSIFVKSILPTHIYIFPNDIVRTRHWVFIVSVDGSVDG